MTKSPILAYHLSFKTLEINSITAIYSFNWIDIQINFSSELKIIFFLLLRLLEEANDIESNPGPKSPKKELKTQVKAVND